MQRDEPAQAAPRALDEAGLRRLLRAAEAAPIRVRTLVMLMLFTALQLYETVALDIDDERIATRKGVLVTCLTDLFNRRGSVVRFFGGRADSACRHGIDLEDTHHALRNAMVVEEVATDPIRYLVLGPDRAGNLLEVVVMDRPHGPAVIQSMAMRAKYRDLLKGRG